MRQKLTRHQFPNRSFAGDIGKMKRIFVAVSFLLLPVFGYAQASSSLQISQTLPPAPVPQFPVSQTVAPSATAILQSNPGVPITLSLKQAEALAVQNNPQISVARLNALASQQATRQVRSNLWPVAAANITGVDSQQN